MRKLRRKRNKKQIHIVLVTAICLISIMTVGYAAFSTNISLTAKGNIKKMTATKFLKKSVVTEGDGLYKNIYEENRYVYKGVAPDNYICLTNQLPCLEQNLYRIISIENDDTIKIVKNTSIGSMSWDKKGARYSSQPNDFCVSANGCKIWGNNKNILDKNGNVITKQASILGGSEYLLPTVDASLNTYLNKDFYQTLPTSIVVSGIFNIGFFIFEGSIEENILAGKEYRWNGNIGLITMMDYIMASTNSKQCNDNYNSAECSTSNWLFKEKTQWTITSNSSNPRDHVLSIRGNDFINISAYQSYQVYPVFYLKSDIQLTGQGTETDPYEIVS